MRILYSIFFIAFSGVCIGQQTTAPGAVTADSVATEVESVEGLEERKVTTRSIEQSTPLMDKKVTRNAYGYEIPMEDAEMSADAPLQLEETIVVANKFESMRIQAATQRTQRSPSIAQQSEMDEAVEYLEETSPNSFEYHYFNYAAGNYDVSRVGDLKEAENLRPNNSDVHVQMAAFNIINGDNNLAREYVNKMIASGRLSRSVLKYSEDILLSTPENGTLITHGFDDSYGTWYAQNVSGIRKDVNLISLDFMQSEHYRNALKNKGYSIPSRENIDVDFLKAFCGLNGQKKLAVSMTTPKEYFGPILNKLYVTGVVFEYRTTQFENFERNEYLWENILKKDLLISANDEKAKSLSANYLPMLLQMRKVYNQLGRTQDVADLDKILDRIGAQCKKYDQVQRLKSAY